MNKLCEPSGILPLASDEPEEKRSNNENIFHISTPSIKDNLSYVGKIDLAALNQSTRAKKK